MEVVLAIFADIDGLRDHTAQYEFPALLFIALSATLCGARSGVDIADFAAANGADLADIVDLPADATPSRDSFSRLFRLLDPEQLEVALLHFAARSVTRDRSAVCISHLSLDLFSQRADAPWGWTARPTGRQEHSARRSGGPGRRTRRSLQTGVATCNVGALGLPPLLCRNKPPDG